MIVFWKKSRKLIYINIYPNFSWKARFFRASKKSSSELQSNLTLKVPLVALTIGYQERKAKSLRVNIRSASWCQFIRRDHRHVGHSAFTPKWHAFRRYSQQLTPNLVVYPITYTFHKHFLSSATVISRLQLKCVFKLWRVA